MTYILAAVHTERLNLLDRTVLFFFVVGDAIGRARVALDLVPDGIEELGGVQRRHCLILVCRHVVYCGAWSQSHLSMTMCMVCCRKINMQVLVSRNGGAMKFLEGQKRKSAGHGALCHSDMGVEACGSPDIGADNFQWRRGKSLALEAN